MCAWVHVCMRARVHACMSVGVASRMRVGMSNVNATLWLRGRREEYDDWPWDIEDIEESFEAVEDAMRCDALDANVV